MEEDGAGDDDAPAVGDAEALALTVGGVCEVAGVVGVATTMPALAPGAAVPVT